MQNTNLQDEIDLVTLLIYLWKKKITIILIAIVCLALGISYIYWGKRAWWTDVEIIQNNQIKSEATQILYAIDELGIYNKTERKDIFEKLYDEFIYGLKSINNINQFYNVKNGSRNVPYKLEVRPDKSNNANPSQFKVKFFSEENSAEAEKLPEILSFINELTLNEFIYETKDIISGNIVLLEQKQKEIQAEFEGVQAASKKTITIAKTQSQNAKNDKLINQDFLTALLKNPNKVISLNSPFLFSLGEDNLNKALHVMSNAPTMYSKEFYSNSARIQYYRKLIAQLDELQFSIYKYDLMPDAPKLRPSNLIVLIISVILGLFIGVMSLLLSFVFTRYEKNY